MCPYSESLYYIVGSWYCPIILDCKSPRQTHLSNTLKSVIPLNYEFRRLKLVYMFQYGKANATLFKRMRMTNPCNSSQWIIEKNLDFFGQFSDILFKKKLNHEMGLNATANTVYKTTIFLYWFILYLIGLFSSLGLYKLFIRDSHWK